MITILILFIKEKLIYCNIDQGYLKLITDSQYIIPLRKSLKILKGQSDAVNRRMTDNTTTKRERTNNDIPNITQKIKD